MGQHRLQRQKGPWQGFRSGLRLRQLHEPIQDRTLNAGAEGLKTDSPSLEDAYIRLFESLFEETDTSYTLAACGHLTGPTNPLGLERGQSRP